MANLLDLTKKAWVYWLGVLGFIFAWGTFLNIMNAGTLGSAAIGLWLIIGLTIGYFTIRKKYDKKEKEYAIQSTVAKGVILVGNILLLIFIVILIVGIVL